MRDKDKKEYDIEYRKELIEEAFNVIKIDKDLIEPYEKIIDIYEHHKNEVDSEIINNIKKIYMQYLKLLDKEFHYYIIAEIEEIKDEQIKDDIENLYIAVSRIKHNNKYDLDNNERCKLGHYTSIKNLKYLVRRSYSDEDKCFLRLNNIEYMNDPNEGNIFAKLLANSNKECKHILDKIYNVHSNSEERVEIKGEGNIFLSSLSENIDNSLPMWRQYGNDGNGCCLVFDAEFFQDKARRNSKLVLNNRFYNHIKLNDFGINSGISGLYNVIYIDKNKILLRDNKQNQVEEKRKNDDIKKCIKYISNILVKIHLEESDIKQVYKVIREILDTVRFLFKDVAYSYEREVRLIRFENIEYKNIEDRSKEKVKCTYDTEGFVVPHLYVNFDKEIELEEVILGPKVTDERGVANYIRYTKKADKITKSKIRYK